MMKSFDEWFQIVKNTGLKFVNNSKNSEYDLMMDWNEERKEMIKLLKRSRTTLWETCYLQSLNLIRSLDKFFEKIGEIK